MTDATIRPMAAHDLAEVTGMIRALAAHHGDVPRLSEATLARDTLGADPWVRVLVADTGNALAGYAALTRLCWLHYGDRGMELYHLFVAPDWRGRGIGRALVEAAKTAARAAGCVELKVGTHPDNASVEGFYLGEGFERQPVVGERFRFHLQSGQADP